MRAPKSAIDGLFYEDSPQIRNKLKKSPQFWGPMPTVADNGWRPPEFPNLSGAKVIGFDTETCDPELSEAGPGWGRGKGHIIGASLAVEDGTSWYFPMRHGILPEGNGMNILPPEHQQMNMDPQQVLNFLNHTLSTNPCPKVGANIIYDVGWLNWEGVSIAGPLYDIQFAEALLDSETPNVALDSLAHKYLGMGKTTEELYEWLSQWNGKPANSNQRAHLYVTPPCMAGPYAEGDASLPIGILAEQWKRMYDRGVSELFDLECRSVRLLVAMRMKGATVNVESAHQVKEELGVRSDNLMKQMTEMVGFGVNPASSPSMVKAFEALGLEVPRKFNKKTGETGISFGKDMLKPINHPFTKLVLEHKGLLKVKDTFLQSYIIDKHVNGRIYCTFHPLKSDDGGTRSGRFASSDPNLQNIPVRTPEGKLVRAAFDGTIRGRRYRSFDYSSIEYRMLVHFAVGQGADEVRAKFVANPNVDYHQIVGELIRDLVGIVLERGPTKTINFGIIYGMALNALASALNLPKDEAKKLLDSYHKAIPYASKTMEMCADEVHATGMVRTILNRASDFNSWSPKKWDEENGFKSHSYDFACKKWGPLNIKRAMTHKALNRKLQGSSADIMKLAMVTSYEQGLFADDACGIPVATIHDELCFEDEGDLDNPAWGELKHNMENCAAHLLRIPLVVDQGVGPTWREAH